MQFTRRSATLLHLGISLAVIVPLLWGLQALWYPAPLFRHDAALPLFLTVGLVAVASGPLLTAIVFKPGKWGMRFDMWVIATVQVAGLAGGLYVMTQSRPVLLVVSEHRAVLVHANELLDQPATPGAEAARPWQRFRVVYAEPPSDVEARTRLLEMTLATGMDIEQQPLYHAPLAAAPGRFWEHLPAASDGPGSDRTLPLLTRRQDTELELLLDAEARQVSSARALPGR